ncbi:tetratricopeptide repeat protein [Hymenobacter endophyticus]|uniref:Tetratricopeptide repeat protein n=1 Tax=Hymenobacter endophyticus TaxID=3076335 RepID=A0ABU3TGG5_9BACT|nr:tetratricopeptide repeat protein [Hymenobacter endophyticus]MDU0370469.1 tetratricopeptide repeat protein [Hymenobacter endophyticus]
MKRNEWHDRAALLFELRRPAEAGKLALQRLVQEPRDLQAHLTLTEALLRQKRLPEALETGQSTIALEPEEPNGFFLMAQIQFQRGRYPEADEMIGHALRLRPGHTHFHAMRSRILWFADQYTAAAEVARTGLAHNPRHADSLMWLGLALHKLRRYDESDVVFRQLLQVAPNSAVARANIGSALHERHHPAAGLHLREALRLDPTLTTAQNLLEKATLQAQWWNRPLLRAYQWRDTIRHHAQGPTLALRLGAVARVLLVLPLLLPLGVLYVLGKVLDWRYLFRGNFSSLSNRWVMAGIAWSLLVLLSVWLLPLPPPLVWLLVAVGLGFPLRNAWVRYQQGQKRFPLGFGMLLSPGGSALLHAYGQLGTTDPGLECRRFLATFGVFLLLYQLLRPNQRP